MTTPDSTQLASDDRSHLEDLAQRLETAWFQTPPFDVEPFLPPPGDPSRLAFLHGLVERAVGVAWQRGGARLLAEYVGRFPELGIERSLPAALVFAEYRARLVAGCNVTVEEYRRRFPGQLPELVRLIAADANTAHELSGTLCAPSANSIVARSGDPATAEQGAARSEDLAPTEGRAKTGGGVATRFPRHAADDAATDGGGFSLDRPTLAPAPSTAGRPFPSPQSITSPHTVAGAPLPTNASSNVPLVASQVLPVSEGFKLFKRIGRGAFGEVFLAEAPGGVNVAVKRIFRPLDDESSRRELQSLQLIRELRHPFLLQTQAFWSLEDRLVIVMELADDSLHEWNQEVRKTTGEGIPAEELVAFFQEAAEGLDYLHQMNVLHRDVKPANLLRLKGHAKVADFGLALMMEDKTAAATFCGTPLYMAPEAWKKSVCAQSDQYSLAVAYAELRTGKPILSGPDYVELCLKHTSGEPELDPLPEAEQRVLLRALAKKPEERFPNCVAFAEALREACAPPTDAPIHRGRGWTAAALVFGLLSVLGALVAVWAFLRPPPPPAVAVQAPPEPLLPADCEPDGTEMDGRYYKRVLHPLAGAAPILFLLVPQNKPGEPAPFYIMRDKVSNGEFNAAVHDPRMGQLLAAETKSGAWAVPGKWKKEGENPGQAALPVVYVTLPEARCFAHLLGGELPTTSQWEKAAGRYDGADGPFELGKPPKGLAIVQNQKPGTPPKPIAVGNPDGDQSIFGCRDMADNGREWTASAVRGELTNLPGGVIMKDKVYLRGGTFLGDEVFRFNDLTKSQSLLAVDAPRNDVGFRVVIEASEPGSR